MFRAFTCALLWPLLGAILLSAGISAAPNPRNFLFEDPDMEATTEAAVSEPVTSSEYVLMEDDRADLSGSDNIIAQASEPEEIVASASSTSSSSSTSTANSVKPSISSNQANLLLLQQLQEQLRRQQVLQNKLQQPLQNSIQSQQQQQPQFSLDALVKSFVKVFQVAKVKIDQGARTVRDILQFFDKKKYTNIIPQASENNLVLT